MSEERASTSRADLSGTATTRGRRSRELPPEVARQFARARSRARALVAAGVAGIVAGVGLVIAAHPAVGALPLILGGIVVFQGERRLARVDAAMRKWRRRELERLDDQDGGDQDREEHEHVDERAERLCLGAQRIEHRPK
jgi:hypothetical protein